MDGCSPLLVGNLRHVGCNGQACQRPCRHPRSFCSRPYVLPLYLKVSKERSGEKRSGEKRSGEKRSGVEEKREEEWRGVERGARIKKNQRE